MHTNSVYTVILYICYIYTNSVYTLIVYIYSVYSLYTLYTQDVVSIQYLVYLMYICTQCVYVYKYGFAYICIHSICRHIYSVHSICAVQCIHIM